MRKFFLTGFGTGYLPVAPGTWGSLPPAVGYLAAMLLHVHPLAISAALVVVALAASAGCVAWGEYAEKAFGQKDPGKVNIDEVAGQAIALAFLPAPVGTRAALMVTGAAFLAFRVFDIVKPPPARGLQKLSAGWGIVIDDLIAGVYANLVCQVIFRVLWT